MHFQLFGHVFLCKDMRFQLFSYVFLSKDVHFCIFSIERHAFSAVFACLSIERHAFAGDFFARTRTPVNYKWIYQLIWLWLWLCLWLWLWLWLWPSIRNNLTRVASATAGPLTVQNDKAYWAPLTLIRICRVYGRYTCTESQYYASIGWVYVGPDGAE